MIFQNEYISVWKEYFSSFFISGDAYSSAPRSYVILILCSQIVWKSEKYGMKSWFKSIFLVCKSLYNKEFELWNRIPWKIL